MVFKPEDFESSCNLCGPAADIVSKRATKLLQEWLEKAPTVYALKAQHCKGFKQKWSLELKETGEMAKLVCIEDIHVNK